MKFAIGHAWTLHMSLWFSKVDCQSLLLQMNACGCQEAVKTCLAGLPKEVVETADTALLVNNQCLARASADIDIELSNASRLANIASCHIAGEPSTHGPDRPRARLCAGCFGLYVPTHLVEH